MAHRGTVGAGRMRAAIAASMVAASVVAACSGVLGIEEREFDPCSTYCDAVLEACSGEFRVFGSKETCMLTCERLPLGADGDKEGNTVGCRLTQARLAVQTREFSEHCPRSGPGGDGTCGTNCEGYCALIEPVCGDDALGGISCEDVCRDVPDKGGYDVYVAPENSIQCRLYHLTSATIDPTHCEHANGNVKCVDLDGGT